VNEVIEEVVTFENGGLNTSVDAMVEVIYEMYSEFLCSICSYFFTLVLCHTCVCVCTLFPLVA
jgi:hypothetical protein